MSSITSQLEQLTASNHLRTVVDFLSDQPEIRNNRRASTQFILFSGSLRSIEEQAENRTQDPHVINISMNQARASLLKILHRHRKVINTITAEVPEPPDRVDHNGNTDGAADDQTILFIYSDPRGVGDTMVEREITKINTVISGSPLRLKIAEDLRRDTLTQTILDAKANILHFSVHGIDGSDGWDPEGIILQDRERNPEVASTEFLEDMFSTLQEVLGIKLVVLNACLSENQARVISRHVPYVVGMNDEIANGIAISFATGFYLGLSRHADNVSFACKMGLRQMKEDGLLGQDLPRLFHGGIEQAIRPEAEDHGGGTD